MLALELIVERKIAEAAARGGGVGEGREESVAAE